MEKDNINNLGENLDNIKQKIEGENTETITPPQNESKEQGGAVLPQVEPIKNRVGRPLKYKTVEELGEKIDGYFNSCFKDDWEDEVWRDEEGNRKKDSEGVYIKVPVRIRKQIKPVTVGGLAVFLETSRETLREYKERPEFVDTIKRAWEFIEMSLENGMLDGSINPTAGIFNAKNNFNWRDKNETDITSGGDKIKGMFEVNIIKGKKTDGENKD
jgi:hypothetical protein